MCIPPTINREITEEEVIGKGCTDATRTMAGGMDLVGRIKREITLIGVPLPIAKAVTIPSIRRVAILPDENRSVGKATDDTVKVEVKEGWKG